MSAVERIFLRYDYLCSYYAGKVIIPKEQAIEKSDIIQELRLRMFSAIRSYLKKYKEYEKSGVGKPMPIKFYLKTVMINRAKDLMREVNDSSFTLSIQSSGMAFGNDKKHFGFDNYNLIVDGQNILDLFHGEEKTIMKLLFIKDFEVKFVVKTYKGKKDVKEVIRIGMEKIRDFLEKSNENYSEFSYFIQEN